jgi:hypothetical protein
LTVLVRLTLRRVSQLRATAEGEASSTQRQFADEDKPREVLLAREFENCFHQSGG